MIRRVDDRIGWPIDLAAGKRLVVSRRRIAPPPLKGWATLLVLWGTLVGAQQLQRTESKYYILHTDLPEVEAREAELRLTRMAEEYFTRTTGFAGKLNAKLPFYLYANPEDYYKAGGAPNSAGFFNGEKMMALTLRRGDGLVSLSTWQVVQHEGFHQFAQAVIGEGLPMWLDEGLAEYFGQGLFTGDGFVAGLVPQARLARVQRILIDPKGKRLAELLAVERSKWNEKIDLADYDLAWSLVHYLSHGRGEEGRRAFVGLIRETGKGGDAAKCFEEKLGEVEGVEKGWKTWWLNQPDHPSAVPYAHATLSILTSFWARAEAVGQHFSSFEALVKTAPADLKQPEEQWLPTSLFQMAVNESIKMRAGGDVFVLGKAAIELKMRDGTKLAGRFEVHEGHVVTRVETVYVPATRPVIRTTTRATGEMLK